MKRTPFLRMADPAEGNTPPDPAEPPKAAKTVLNSDAKESDAAETVRLKHQLEEERGKNKTLAEENAKLKTPPKPPEPKPPENKKSGLMDWLF